MKYIVTTTINEPTEALLQYAALPGWQLVVVGDLITPHQAYEKLDDVIYLSPDHQEDLAPELSEAIGWRCIQRRNIGLLFAYKHGAEVVATVDDDNIPYAGWGQDLLVGKTVEVDEYESSTSFFDPLSVSSHSHLWHRGFPIQYLQKREPRYIGKKTVLCDVQADLWDGDPDVDAICRLVYRPDVEFGFLDPFTTSSLVPFNSQNTFLSRRALRRYLMIPYIGRMDDIWGAYLLQQLWNEDELGIVFCRPSVRQDRNDHDLTKDFSGEIIGYENSWKIAQTDVRELLPEAARKAVEIYFRSIDELT